MKNNLKTNSNEIDLIQLAILFWEGKWKILLAIFTSVALYYYINSTQQIRYTAITRIDAISSSEFSKYLPIIKNFSKYIYDTNSPKMTNSATQNLKLSKENFLLF